MLSKIVTLIVLLSASVLTSYGQLNHLAEKPYLQTDRSYYYPGESIWFKAYMLYGSAQFKDSLSKVLYVELVDAQNTNSKSKAYEIRTGTSIGDIALDDAISPGDYTLRAYTQWMLNFDTAFVFQKPIKILKLDELVRTTADHKTLSTSDVIIASKKEVYAPREKVELFIRMAGPAGNSLASNLSISVTDLNQAWPAKNESSILARFRLPRVAMKPREKELMHPMQKGFDLSGTLLSDKQKEIKGELTFVHEDNESKFTITTEENGHFFIPDVLLFDSAKISYSASVSKGRYGSVIFDSTRVLPNTTPSTPLDVKVYESGKQKLIYNTDAGMRTTLLKSVTIRDSRIAETNRSITADYEVSGDWLRERNPVDILSAIQSKIPGLRIIVRNGGGIPVRIIQLLGPSSLEGTSEPLVLVDGLALDDREMTMADQISALTPDVIDRIEVSKFGSGAAYGSRGANGVIAIFTRRTSSMPVAKIVTADPKSRPLKLMGFSSPHKFYSPDYADPEQSKDPSDSRITLYWNPSLQADSKPLAVSFYAAEVVTQYRIVVEGVMANGKAVRCEKIISIK